MLKLRSLLLAIPFLMAMSISNASVWESKNTWDERWEDKYAEWIKTHITTDMFTNINSPYYGIATDCADLIYIARAIFSHDNSLPFITNTRWANNDERISNETDRFDRVSDTVQTVKIRNDKGELKEITLPRTLNNGKLRAFLVRLGHRVGTWSLPQDTYPISVDTKNLRPGVVYLRQGYNRMSLLEAIQTFLTGTPPNPEAGPGHALMVHDVRNTGSIEFIQSTLPKKVRDLSMIYEIELLPTNEKLGFRRFISPDQVGKRVNSNFIGYSTEQFTDLGRERYSSSICNSEIADTNCWNSSNSDNKSDRRNITEFRNDVMTRLATRSESKSERQERIVKTICGAIQQRADVILTAEPSRLSFRNGCMDPGTYDNFSTPSRDEQIKQFIKQVSLYNRAVTRQLTECGSVVIDYTEKKYPIIDLVKNISSGNYSSDPNEAISVRWGFAKPTNRCPAPKN